MAATGDPAGVVHAIEGRWGGSTPSANGPKPWPCRINRRSAANAPRPTGAAQGTVRLARAAAPAPPRSRRRWSARGRRPGRLAARRPSVRAAAAQR